MHSKIYYGLLKVINKQKHRSATPGMCARAFLARLHIQEHSPTLCLGCFYSYHPFLLMTRFFYHFIPSSSVSLSCSVLPPTKPYVWGVPGEREPPLRAGRLMWESFLCAACKHSRVVCVSRLLTLWLAACFLHLLPLLFGLSYQT